MVFLEVAGRRTFTFYPVDLHFLVGFSWVYGEVLPKSHLVCGAKNWPRQMRVGYETNPSNTFRSRLVPCKLTSRRSCGIGLRYWDPLSVPEAWQVQNCGFLEPIRPPNDELSRFLVSSLLKHCLVLVEISNKRAAKCPRGTLILIVLGETFAQSYMFFAKKSTVKYVKTASFSWRFPRHPPKNSQIWLLLCRNPPYYFDDNKIKYTKNGPFVGECAVPESIVLLPHETENSEFAVRSRN